MTLRGRRWRWTLLPLLGGLLLALTGCGPQNGQNSLRPAGPQAQKIDNLFIPVVIVACLVFVLVSVGTLYAVFRFRHRAGRPDDVKQVHGNTPLEIGWTIVPALILAIIAVPTVRTIFDLADNPGPEALTVNVEGKQWWWSFEYPEEKIVTSTELHIPTGRPVKLNLRACDGEPGALTCNVIHSFWIPELNGKKDVVPGRVNHLTIEADKPGTYLGQCAEYCGLSHANMRMRVIAQTPEDYADWVRSVSGGPVSTPSTAVNNLMTTTFGCNGCHTWTNSDQATYGPNLTHLALRSTFAGGTETLNHANLVDWLLDAPGLVPMESQKCLLPPPATCVGMPSFTKNLPSGFTAMTAGQASEIADFLLSLK